MSDSLKAQLQGIYEQHGVLTADVVVQEATDPDHPLHHRFQWDDTEAARSWRLSQASELIRSVRIKYAERSDGSPKDLRAFVAVREPEASKAYYKPVEEVAADPFTSALVLRQMEREWKSFRRRYEHLAEFTAMVQADMTEKAG